MFSWIVSSLRSLVHFSSRVFTPRSVVEASSYMSFFALSWSSFNKASASMAHSFSFAFGRRNSTGRAAEHARTGQLLSALLVNFHHLHTHLAQDVVHAQAPHRPRDRARKLRPSGRPRPSDHPASAARGRDAGRRYIRG